MVANAPTFAEVANQVALFSQNCVFVAHNVNFDYGFFRNEFARLGQSYRRAKVCTVQEMRKAFPKRSSYSLAALTQAFDIKLTNHHRALDDAKAAAELFLIASAELYPA